VAFYRGEAVRLSDGKVVLRREIGGRCPDCDLRGALDHLGQPRRHRHYGFKLTIGCDNCGGTGVDSEVVKLDPSALKRLTPKQRFVIEGRLGLTDGTRYTQRQIAAAMGTSHQAVCKLEKGARKRLYELIGGLPNKVESLSRVEAPSARSRVWRTSGIPKRQPITTYWRVQLGQFIIETESRFMRDILELAQVQLNGAVEQLQDVSSLLDYLRTLSDDEQIEAELEELRVAS
jgi:transcriptional regulator with XRE-family HTH domain